MYMKRLLCADLHIGKGTVKEDEVFDIADFILETAIAKKCTHLDILGDLLENRALLMFRIWPRVQSWFDKLIEAGITVNLMAGNHDFYGNEVRRPSNFRYVQLNPAVNIIDTLFTDPDGVVWVPWLFKDEKIDTTGGKVVFAHLPINGFRMTKSMIADNGVDLAGTTDLPIYAGDFHLAQVSGNIRYLGSIMHHTWNDANTKKSIYVLDEKFQVEEVVPLNPLFTDLLKINYSELSDLQIEGKARVTVTDVPKGEEELVIQVATNKGATSVECLSKSDEVDDEEQEVDGHMTVDEAIGEQVDLHDMTDELAEFHQEMKNG